MSTKPAVGLFITGTDTNVGKTYVAACIARDLHAQGVKVGVYKPAASGCVVNEQGELVADDALQLWEAAGRPGELSAVCPQRFAAPVAPHLAAQAEGKQLDPQLLRAGLQYWKERSDFILVEGAGGLMSPLGEDYVADLAAEFGFPLVVVAVNKLGVINQTLQTLIVAETWPQPLVIAGVVLNHVQQADATADPSLTSNRSELVHRSVAPILAELSFGSNHLDAQVDWLTLARRTS
ncbi:MAG TPA: dethiobiotin synthase [Pirellulaceae bacterium]|nr:dethiobiotin synthase [Pirellulaceae bacterium]